MSHQTEIDFVDKISQDSIAQMVVISVLPPELALLVGRDSLTLSILSLFPFQNLFFISTITQAFERSHRF